MRIAPGTQLPDEAVTETFAMLAKRGTGKSNAAVVMAEEMTDAGHQWVAIDPKGDWWGIRSSADGTGPGLEVPVFGGRHGDLPLEATAGTLLARLIVERDLTVVLDVSLFSKADQIRFVTDFAEALFRAVGDSPRPLHLFLEEAEEFLPQRVDARSARMVGAYSKIAKQGRTSGLGVSLITQRSASLNKDALSQTDTLILFRTVSPHDRKAVVAWAEHHDEAKDVASSLADLKPGESWILSPGFLGSIEKVQWRRRRTFDSGATPLTGKTRRKDPVSLADIDLAEIKELMADTVERAKACDPKELLKRIRHLEQELSERPTAEPVVEHVEVEVIRDRVPVDAIEAAKDLGLLTDSLIKLLETYRHLDDRPGGGGAPAQRPEPRRAPAATSTARPPAPTRPSPGPGANLPGPQRKLLTVLAVYGPRTKRQLAMQAGYSASGGGFNNPLSALRSSGLVERGDPIVITQAGLDALGDYDPLPTGQALIDHWMGQLKGPEKKILQPLIDAHPRTMTKDELADAAGYDPSGGGFNNPLSRLRSLELVIRGPDIGLTDDFAEAIT